jgi:hypothetical protein
MDLFLIQPQDFVWRSAHQHRQVIMQKTQHNAVLRPVSLVTQTPSRESAWRSARRAIMGREQNATLPVHRFLRQSMLMIQQIYA